MLAAVTPAQEYVPEHRPQGSVVPARDEPYATWIFVSPEFHGALVRLIVLWRIRGAFTRNLPKNARTPFSLGVCERLVEQLKEDHGRGAAFILHQRPGDVVGGGGWGGRTGAGEGGGGWLAGPRTHSRTACAALSPHNTCRARVPAQVAVWPGWVHAVWTHGPCVKLAYDHIQPSELWAYAAAQRCVQAPLAADKHACYTPVDDPMALQPLLQRLLPAATARVAPRRDE